jgi:two-component system, NarL family, sensor histidine kinase DevS
MTERQDQVSTVRGAPRRAGRVASRAASDTDVLGLADEHLAAFVEAMPDGVVVADAAGTIRLLNRRVEELFGWSRGDLVGQTVEQLLPPDARVEHIRHRADYAAAPAIRPMGAGLELEGVRRDGSAFPVEISLSPMLTADGTLVVASVRDITERRAVEDRALVAERELAQLEDRERIARELHDTVIQRLFATGMALQSMASQVPADQAPRLEQAVDDLDETIREVRTAIFGLRSHLDWAGGRPLAPRVDDDALAIDQHGSDLEGQEDQP